MIRNSKIIKNIEESSYYDDFKFIEGNRPIDLCHVSEIMEYIKEGNDMLPPALINENNEIIDGQHRTTAWIELGLPIRYYMEPKAGFEEMLKFNISANTWTLNDYLSSGVARKIETYIKFKELINNYKLNLSDLIVIIDGLNKNQIGEKSMTQLFKQGNLKIDNYNNIIDFLEDLYLFSDFDGFLGTSFVRMFLKLYISSFYDSEYMKFRATSNGNQKEIARFKKGVMEDYGIDLANLYTSKARNIKIVYADGEFSKLGNQGRRSL